jgi:hypothetical protein
MSTALTVLNNTAIQEGGLGVDFGNKLFKVKPGTLTIVQNNSTIEGALKGHLRIAETGDQYKELTATLLMMPQEQRQYHIGNPGEMNRTPENLVCFSRDLIKPDPKSKIPQAILCANCPRSDWTAWSEYKAANNGQTNKALIPPCDAHYVAYLLDTKYQLPLRMYFRSKAKTEFEAATQNLSRVLMMKKAEGKNPNIFDVQFKISVKEIITGKFKSYVPKFSDFKYITDEEREKFGAVYFQLLESFKKPVTTEEDAVAEAEAEVDSVVEGEYIAGDDKEITI